MGHDRNSYIWLICRTGLCDLYILLWRAVFYTRSILQLCGPTCLSIFFMPSSSSSSSSSVSSPSAPSFPVDRHLHVLSFYKHTVITQGSNWLGSCFAKSRSRHKNWNQYRLYTTLNGTYQGSPCQVTHWFFHCNNCFAKILYISVFVHCSFNARHLYDIKTLCQSTPLRPK